MKFAVVTEAPGWYILLCVLAAALYAVVLYFRDKRLEEVRRWVRTAMGVFRFVVVFILSFLLLSPLLKSISRKVEKPVIVIAQDASGSLVMGKDSLFNRNEFPAKLQALQEALADKYEVRTYSFGDHFRQGTDFNYPDKFTDFSSLFEEIETRYTDQNLGAVVVASDGIYNQGRSPVYAAERIKAPVFAIGMGDTTVRKDLVLTKVAHNRIAFLGNTFPLEVVVDAHRCAGEKAVLTVSKGGQVLASKPVDIGTDPFNITIPVELTANNPGLQKFTVALTILDGEANLLNNRQDIFIDVLDGRQKILVLGAAPHPDMGALKMAIESNDNYQVETATLDKFDKPVKGYNLVILHAIPSDNGSAQRLLSELAMAKIPVWYITGVQQRYSAFNNQSTGIAIQTSASRSNDCEPVPVADFPLFNLSEQAAAYIPKFPAVSTPFGNFQSSPAVTPFMRQKIGSLRTDYPLWVFSQQSDRKVCVFIGEGIWKWRLRDYADHGNHDIFNELVGKTVQYLSVREDKSFFRVSGKNNFLENEPVQLDAEVYNESYELINTPVVTVDIINSDGKRFPSTFSQSGKGYFLNAGLFPVGEYKYEARTKVNDKAYTQSGTFSVSPLLVEIANTTADHQVLYNLAKQHNGELYRADETEKLAQTLLSREDIKPVIYNTKTLDDLINVWWIFALLVALLSLEWFMRKRNGAY